ncbi:hypothetical protein DFH07DRAFT_979947 [Mycena maculata]|uniref:Uncharacterized protein n=1 Tax=Mycena maculata TaxID=230809 RepID=A0AAD7N2J4_9AGAR|nr:hypothetical protein DFH07DRAFT_979947 [Mycena maculata]
MPTAHKEDCGKVLLADGRMSIETAPKAKQQQFKALAVICTATSELKRLHKHQFYRPRESNFPTFDSFYSDRNHHAFVLQASEADKTHTVNDLGRVWMEGHGIDRFTYIYVSGPKMDKRPTISLPVKHESQFIDIYHLVLDYPEDLQDGTNCRRVRRRETTKSYNKVCAMILESGAVYCIGTVVYISLVWPLPVIVGSQVVPGAIVGQLVGIAPTIIAVRVGLGQSVENVQSLAGGSVPISAIDFNHTFGTQSSPVNEESVVETQGDEEIKLEAT